MSEMISQENRFNVARRLIARELAHLIAVREAGFCLRDVQISSSEAQRPFAVRRPSLGLFDAAKEYGPKTYMEKRLFVLCAAGWGESIVVLSEKEKSGETCTGYEFWECFEIEDWSVFPGRAAISDYKLAREIATAYRSLIAANAPSIEQDLSDEFHCQAMCGFMHTFGVTPLGRLLTGNEFLKLLDRIVEREVNQDGSLRNSIVTLGGAEIEAYLPGEPDDETNKTGIPQSGSSITDSSNIIPTEKLPIEIRRIFAHELGHWLAARIVGIGTSGVQLEWVRQGVAVSAVGFCTVFLGSACITLGFERYLESRIASLAAGPLADCEMRFPEKKAIGDELYKTLHFGHGNDDFEKLAELAIIHGAKHLTQSHGSAPLGREVNSGQVLETIVGILNRSKLLPIIRSAEYLSFIYEVIEQQQKEGASDWMVENRIKIDISTDQISGSLESHEGLTALIQEQRSS